MPQLNDQPQSSNSELIECPEIELLQVARWSDSHSICSLSDAERHLGQIVNAGDCWIAFDAIHLNEEGTGFAVLGTFPEMASAKRAVEEACRVVTVRRAFRPRCAERQAGQSQPRSQTAAKRHRAAGA
jgi:hypothetical protein